MHIVKAATSWGQRFVDFLFPYHCPVCGKRAEKDERPICLKCNMYMPRTDYASHPYDNYMAKEYTMVRNVEKVAALVFHLPGSDFARVIYDMKYHNAVPLCERMGELMAHELILTSFFEGIDMLIPLPLSVGRRMERGYNQSEYLARGVGKITGLPVVRHAVLRKDFKESQTHLTRLERKDNVDGSFVLTDSEAISNKHVLLIDDVITTGATTKACIEAMQDAENVKISILSLAYAGRKI